MTEQSESKSKKKRQKRSEVCLLKSKIKHSLTSIDRRAKLGKIQEGGGGGVAERQPRFEQGKVAIILNGLPDKNI